MTHAAVALLSAGENNLGIAHDKQTLIRKFAEHHHLSMVGFLVVEPGSVTTALNHALSLCSVHQARVIVVDQYSTLFLLPKDLKKTLALLVEQKITLAYAHDGCILSEEALNGVYHLLSASIVCEQEHRSSRIKKSLLAIKKKGRHLGGKAFGGSSQELTVIKQIVKLHEDGFSLQKICDLLLVNNIKTVSNKRWHPTTVKRILERAKGLEKRGTHEK